MDVSKVCAVLALLLLRLEERLFKRLKWEWPADETEALWWVANYGDADQTKEVKLICRSMACIKMELHKARLATSSKLRAEWENRLENNSRAVDELNTNRSLWIQAGGPDPELLVSPTEIHMDQCTKAVEMLEKMLMKNGPKGGRASTGECHTCAQ